MTVRLGVVQAGDYLGACDRLAAGEGEFYFGVSESVGALQRFWAGRDHFVINLDAPAGEKRRGEGVYLGEPAPDWPNAIPGRLLHEFWAIRVLAALRAYRPTHVLLRTGGIVGIRIAEYCAANQIPTLVVLANALDRETPRQRTRARKFMALLNADCFVRVANFKAPAVQSMIDFGLAAEKTAAYEFKGARRPHDYSVKSLSAEGFIRLVFAARMTEEKGAVDAIDAAALVRAMGRPVRLTLIGDGPALPALRARAQTLSEGAVEFTGWLPNEVMFERLLEATLAFAPTWHAFSEGMPMALTEALASRTPAIISDHPVFSAAFRNQEGVLICPEKNPKALAAAVVRCVDDPAFYREMSETTLAAFERVAAPNSFTDILGDWRLS